MDERQIEPNAEKKRIMSVVRKESDRNKVLQEKCQAMLTNMLRDEDNKYCVDCDAKGSQFGAQSNMEFSSF